MSIIAISYRKDKAIHTKQFKGSLWVLVAFIVFIALLTGLKYALR
ncbi:MAG: hypothetical protein VW961_01015 [Flavobacteriaceae bacterium]